MTEPTDLIKRLRDRSTWRDAFHRCIIQPELLTEAADEISTLRDRVAALEGALEEIAHNDPIDPWGLARSILSRAQQGGGDV